MQILHCRTVPVADLLDRLLEHAWSSSAPERLACSVQSLAIVLGTPRVLLLLAAASPTGLMLIRNFKHLSLVVPGPFGAEHRTVD